MYAAPILFSDHIISRRSSSPPNSNNIARSDAEREVSSRQWLALNTTLPTDITHIHGYINISGNLDSEGGGDVPVIQTNDHASSRTVLSFESLPIRSIRRSPNLQAPFPTPSAVPANRPSSPGSGDQPIPESELRDARRGPFPSRLSSLSATAHTNSLYANGSQQGSPAGVPRRRVVSTNRWRGRRPESRHVTPPRRILSEFRSSTAAQGGVQAENLHEQRRRRSSMRRVAFRHRIRRKPRTNQAYLQSL